MYRGNRRRYRGNQMRSATRGAPFPKYSVALRAVNVRQGNRVSMIRGSSVVLRPITAGDLPLLRAWQSDPAIMAGWGMPMPLLPAAALEHDLNGRFAQFDERGYLIIESPEGPVGRIDFGQLDQRHGSCEIALYIGDKAAQGRGYAADAIRALAGFLFDQRRLRRIELTVMASNQRAIRLYERIGFVTEGVLRDHVFFDDGFHDEVMMALHPDTMRDPIAEPRVPEIVQTRRRDQQRPR
jgi:RimJ/RimL family protein N-acetyltransferase